MRRYGTTFYDDKLELLCNRRTMWRLRTNDFDGLKNSNWNELIEEMDQKCPEVLDVMITICLPKNKVFTQDFLDKISRKITLCYGILMQSRCKELSLIKRMLTVILTEGAASKQVIHRLVAFFCFSVRFL